MTVVLPVECHGMPGQESSHECGEGSFSCSKQKMGIVGHKRPCIAGCVCFIKGDFKALNKRIPIFIVSKDLASFYPPDDHVVEHSGGI
jgi:hypothetical protein